MLLAHLWHCKVVDSDMPLLAEVMQLPLQFFPGCPADSLGMLLGPRTGIECDGQHLSTGLGFSFLLWSAMAEMATLAECREVCLEGVLFVSVIIIAVGLECFGPRTVVLHWVPSVDALVRDAG
ncbi:hypothetical protein Nepgr_019626 [Nepenthes gracilis]|uniref:Uncharacterized protein n=1 Tax=Nepenthes gracilis TaxID=150966 RepID=A0AAD3SVD6_NEPGR|nr:hypothetical protein Nepgr_019626 [Nepenthes gracilis]